MSKLLHKPFRAFSLYALVILACSIPVYYTAVNFIWLEELDEHNLMVKEQVTHRLSEVHMDSAQLAQVLQLWNVLQPGTTLMPGRLPLAEDSLYTLSRKSPYINSETDRLRGLLTPVSIGGKSYLLRIETNVEEADETIMAIGIVTLCFFLLLVSGFIVLNRRIAGKVWQPFYATLEKLRSFELSADKPLALAQTDIAEFDELHRVLQKLTDNNRSVFRQQKIFIENASHELQTPLAVLKSKTDLLLQHKDLHPEQAAILGALQLHLARVTRINKNLLLLARIENDQFTEKEQLHLAPILREHIALLADYAGDRNITLDIHQQAEAVIDCNKFLLETLLNNLLTNAIRHSPATSELLVMLQGRMLCFYNTGSEVLDTARLFKRFSIAASAGTSSGLGLAIVQEIATHYGWQVSYSFSKGKHCFCVSF